MPLVDEEAPPPPSPLLPRVLVSVGIIAALLAGAAFGFKKLKDLKPPVEKVDARTPPILVRAAAVQRTDHTEVLRGYGVAQALRRTQAVAQMDGRVVFAAPKLDEGDELHFVPANGAGSQRESPVLVRLDTRDIDDRVAKLRIDTQAIALEVDRLALEATSLTGRLELARDELATAQREYERIKGLVPKTFSPSDLDRQRLVVTLQERRIQDLSWSMQNNQAQAKVAKARIASAEKSIELEQRMLEYTVIRAPAEGRVTKRAVEVGDWVRRGDVLFEFVDLSKTQIPIALAASRYDDVEPGARTVLVDPATQETLWEGEVVRRAPMIDTTARTFHAFVEIEGTPHANALPPGRHVQARVDGRVTPNVFVVPRQAFLEGDLYVAAEARPTFWTPWRTWMAGLPHSERRVYQVQMREAQVERWLSGVALVSAGLTPGDWLVLTNLESIGAGGQVRVTLDAPSDAGD